MAGCRGWKTSWGPETHSCHLSALLSTWLEPFQAPSRDTPRRRCFSFNTNPREGSIWPTWVIYRPCISHGGQGIPGQGHTLLSLQEVVKSAHPNPVDGVGRKGGWALSSSATGRHHSVSKVYLKLCQGSLSVPWGPRRLWVLENPCVRFSSLWCRPLESRACRTNCTECTDRVELPRPHPQPLERG